MLVLSSRLLAQSQDNTLREHPRRVHAIGELKQRIGDTVSIAGRITLGSDVISAERLRVYVQDATGGTMLTADAIPARMGIGDSVEVHGVVRGSGSGEPRVQVMQLRRLRVPPRLLDATHVSADDSAMHAAVGTLVSTQGRVISRESENGDESLILVSPGRASRRIAVEAEDQVASSVDLKRFGPGDEISATGVLTMRRSSGHEPRSYTILVRKRSDTVAHGLTAHERHLLIVASAASALLALAWLLVSRIQARRAIRRLRHAEAQLRATYEVSSDAILLLDEDWKIVDANPAATSLLASEAATLRDTHIAGVFTLEARARLDSTRVAMAAIDSMDLETEVRRGADASLPVSARFTAIDIGGRQRIVAVLRDISERVRAEAEMRSILAAMKDVVLVLGRDGEYLRIAATNAALLYAPPLELLGRNVRDILPIADAEAVCTVIREALGSDEPVDYEYALPIRGQEIWFNATVTRLDDASVVWVARDTTLKHRAADALRESESRYRSLFDNNPAPMWVFDDATMMFLAVNESAIGHYGYSREEFLGMTVLEIRPKEDVPAFLAQRRNADATRRKFGPHRHRRKDGSMFDVEVVTDSFPFNGGTANLVIAHDVTERRALEAQLRQAQKIEAVGMLAGGIAHDFNNILTAIHAHAGFLRESLDGNDERNEDVEEIAKAAERASGLTRQLLAFSRKQILKPTVLDINVVVTQLEKMLGRLLGEDIRMAVTCSDTLDRVLADPSQIEQVLINLAINARDAMPKGGTLSINTTNVEVNRADVASRPGLTPGQYVRLIVSDNGGGMPEYIRARIFEPFFTTKESGQGTGLGLSTVYGIVKQSGGYIHVASEVNRGTTFEILLPRSDEVAPERQAPDLGSCPSRAGATILLVEDEVAVRSVASRILQRAGYVVLEAKDGRDAVRLASSHTGSIDLVLTDAVMPDLGGADVARAVEEARPGTPILFMSGYTEDEIIRRHILMDTGMFLEKPFTPESLKNAVRSALEASVTAEAEV